LIAQLGAGEAEDVADAAADGDAEAGPDGDADVVGAAVTVGDAPADAVEVPWVFAMDPQAARAPESTRVTTSIFLTIR
jgi:hypothetical protein